jgi:acyl-CoA synthetase (NDP forming)
VALLLETLRAPSTLRAALAPASDTGIPVVALTVGSSEAGRAMVAAHSGSLAGSDGAWEALFGAYGVLRVQDLAEMCDTLELLVSPRRPPPRPAGSPSGVAAVLDSGAERALLVDVAADVDLRLAEVSSATLQRPAELLDRGLVPANPLDVWGTGASTAELFTGSLLALAGDEAVDADALAVDLVPEFDGDDSYRTAIIAAHEGTALPLCVLSNVPSADRLVEEASRFAAERVIYGQPIAGYQLIQAMLADSLTELFAARGRSSTRRPAASTRGETERCSTRRRRW